MKVPIIFVEIIILRLLLAVILPKIKEELNVLSYQSDSFIYQNVGCNQVHDLDCNLNCIMALLTH